MKNDTLELLKKVYANDSSCIFILDSSLSLVWHNGKKMPFEPDDDSKEIFGLHEKSTPKSGDYSYNANGIIYEYHLTNVSGEYYVIMCSDIPAVYKGLESRYTRENLENTLAASKLEILNISAAAARLNDYFEESCFDDTAYDELNEQTNVIMKNCSAVLKEHYLMEELLRYYREDETEGTVINFSEIVKAFAKNCCRIIGYRGSTRISCDISENIFIKASSGRVEYFLLCLLVLLRKKYKGIYDLKISAFVLYDELCLNMKLIKVGDDEENKPLLSEFVPINRDIPVYEIENMVVRRFLERYNGVLIDSTDGGNSMFSIRLPVAEDDDMDMKFSSQRRSIAGESIITPYHAILCDISNFRYY